jgi:alpha 1,3-glucosidase
VIITDPHIKVDNEYSVYTNGLLSGDDPTIGVYVRSSNNVEPYVGDCWPKDSVWVDFLNPKACNYWKSLYKYDSFKGTSSLFNFWIDMNEPSVFSGEELTMDKNAIH